MNQLSQVFSYEGVQIKTLVEDGEPLFMAKDVCEVLELDDVSKAVNRLENDEKLTRTIFASGQNREMLFVTEAGLYSLIFSSRKPEAKLFRRWVMHEVLPTIRKTGGYVANDDLFIKTYLPHADEQTKMMFSATLLTVRQQNETIALMKPKAEYFDQLVERNLLTSIRDTAKELKVKEKNFVSWLLSKKFLYRDTKGKLKPYADHVPNLFEMKEFEVRGYVDNQTLVTPRGRETFRLLLDKDSMRVS